MTPRCAAFAWHTDRQFLHLLAPFVSVCQLNRAAPFLLHCQVVPCSPKRFASTRLMHVFHLTLRCACATPWQIHEFNLLQTNVNEMVSKMKKDRKKSLACYDGSLFSKTQACQRRLDLFAAWCTIEECDRPWIRKERAATFSGGSALAGNSAGTEGP